jgi:threonine-phosphate decarboxylase
MNRSLNHGGTVLSIARQLGVPPESILDFSASINPLGPSPGVRKAAIEAFELAGHYPEIGSPALCKALSAYHSIPDDNIAVANGSTELIHLVPRLFRRAAGRALLIAPTFSEYANALELAGWKFDYLTLGHEDGFTLDCNRVAEELAKGYDLLFFCNPGNPTGKLYSLDDVETLYRLCRSSGCFFVLDEAFIDFEEESSAKLLIPDSDSGVILRSMTKFFGFPGIRVGYSIASPDVTSRLKRFLPPWNVGVIPQAAALAALADTDHCRGTLNIVEKERCHLVDSLSRLKGVNVFESAANYLLIRLDSGLTATELQEKLLEELLLIRDCSNFKGLDNRFFRIAVKGETENKKLLHAVAGVLKREPV